jgi:hypothetical protein
MADITPQEALVWVQVGTTLFQVAKGPVESVFAAIHSQPDLEKDNAQLDATHAAYLAREAQAEKDAGVTPND